MVNKIFTLFMFMFCMSVYSLCVSTVCPFSASMHACDYVSCVFVTSRQWDHSLLGRQLNRGADV